jgi:hypothetical protein
MICFNEKKVAGALIDPLHRINFGTENRRKFNTKSQKTQFLFEAVAST